MDVFSLGTPVIDQFAKVSKAGLVKFGLTPGATNRMDATKLASMERALGKRIIYRYPGDNARNVCEGVAALGGFAAYQGAVGTDKQASEIEANLSDCGISNFLQEKRGSTGRIIALVSPDAEALHKAVACCECQNQGEDLC